MTDSAHTLLAQIERDVLDDNVALASILRRCIVLAGRADAAELRTWATKELRGYELDDADVPTYRKVGAPIKVDAIAGPSRITGQRISPRQLPEGARDIFTETYTLYVGVGEIEALFEQAVDGYIQLALPGAPDIAALMDRAAGQPFQNITAVYWKIAVASLRSALDHVRTTLAEMIAELHTSVPASGEPDPGQIDKALSLAVHGSGHTINLLNNQARDHSQASITGAAADPTLPDSPFWTRGRKIGAFLVGIATVGAGAATVWATFK